MSFEAQDKAITAISNWRKAQDIYDNLAVTELHARMDDADASSAETASPSWAHQKDRQTYSTT